MLEQISFPLLEHEWYASFILCFILDCKKWPVNAIFHATHHLEPAFGSLADRSSHQNLPSAGTSASTRAAASAWDRAFAEFVISKYKWQPRLPSSCSSIAAAWPLDPDRVSAFRKRRTVPSPSNRDKRGVRTLAFSVRSQTALSQASPCFYNTIPCCLRLTYWKSSCV